MALLGLPRSRSRVGPSGSGRQASRARRGVCPALASLAVATLVLAGCAGSSGQPIDEPPELTGDAVHAEFGKAMFRCLREAGWDTTLDEDGNARTSFPEEQEEAFDAAWRDCMNRLGYDKDPAPLTDAQFPTAPPRVRSRAR